MACYPIPRGGVAGAVEWAWALLVNSFPAGARGPGLRLSLAAFRALPGPVLWRAGLGRWLAPVGLAGI